MFPVLAFVAGYEDVTVGGAEINFARVARIRFQRDHCSAGWSDLVPLLSRASHRTGQRKRYRADPLRVHTHAFSQRGLVPTRKESKSCSGTARLSRGADLGQTVIVLVLNSVEARFSNFLSVFGFLLSEYSFNRLPGWPEGRNASGRGRCYEHQSDFQPNQVCRNFVGRFSLSRRGSAGAGCPTSAR